VISTFRDIEVNWHAPRLMILRHDVDLNIEGALHLAEVEADLGVQASYFVRLHARLYNPYELRTYRILHRILDMGHEIGLHYEPDFARLNGVASLDMLKREREVLEMILDRPVVSASAHMPWLSGYAPDEDNLGRAGLRYEAYLPRFTQDLKYLSDSGGRWREGCFCQHVGNVPRMQVLVHPFWWFQESLLENF